MLNPLEKSSNSHIPLLSVHPRVRGGGDIYETKGGEADWLFPIRGPKLIKLISMILTTTILGIWKVQVGEFLFYIIETLHLCVFGSLATLSSLGLFSYLDEIYV